ncbi:MAG TPA: hypothetical protein VKG78_05580 [Opitutaceae bacterium]|nr:hypothetical protein [Opitutaceae bacterium]
MNPKPSILPAVIFLAAIAASVLLPVGAAGASILLSVTGLISVLAADYGRTVEPLRAPARVVPLRGARRPSAEYRAAA